MRCRGENLRGFVGIIRELNVVSLAVCMLVSADFKNSEFPICSLFRENAMGNHLSPPQRLLLVNTSERKKREAGALERENGSVFRATVGGLCEGEREITVHRQDAAVLGGLRPAVLRLWEPELKELELGKLSMEKFLVLRIV